MSDPVAVKNMMALRDKSYDIKFDIRADLYEPLENIGTGAYGVVCSAIQKETKEKVAIKKIPCIFEQPIIAKRTYREIRILKHFKHDNVIAIREILKPPEPLEKFKDVYIVLDLMESDLHRIIHSKQELTGEHARYFLYQILRGLKYIHSANVVHRDLKPSNLLVNENCELKIGDFGMARGLSSDMEGFPLMITQYVATRWYRAPELMILPKETYTAAIDVWSVGCIFAEMLGRKQIFPGQNPSHQLQLIIGYLGTPSDSVIKLTKSEVIKSFILGLGRKKPIPWKEVYPKAHKKALDLVGKMLVIDPRDRVTVEQALRHPYLSMYHDPDDEPSCIPVFNFDFEKIQMDTNEFKQVIVKEIMDYHQPKSQLKNFDLRPVPKVALAPVDKPQTGGSTGLEAYLQHEQLRQRQQTAKPPETQHVSSEESLLPHFQNLKPEQQKEQREVTDLEQLLTSQKPDVALPEGQRESKPDVVSFKKPDNLLALVVEASETKLELPKTSYDIEMLSAKSTDSVTMTETAVKQGARTETLRVFPKPEIDSNDVTMLSAKLSAELAVVIDNKAEVIDARLEQAEPEKPQDTKALIRMALLNQEMRRKKEENANKLRPITAIQRQREREDKRKKKMVRAVERRKKDKKKEKHEEHVLLTDEDKNLLARWSTMQTTPQTQQVTQPSQVSTAQPVLLSQQTLTRVDSPPQGQVTLKDPLQYQLTQPGVTSTTDDTASSAQVHFQGFSRPVDYMSHPSDEAYVNILDRAAPPEGYPAGRFVPAGGQSHLIQGGSQLGLQGQGQGHALPPGTHADFKGKPVQIFTTQHSPDLLSDMGLLDSASPRMRPHLDATGSGDVVEGGAGAAAPSDLNSKEDWAQSSYFARVPSAGDSAGRLPSYNEALQAKVQPHMFPADVNNHGLLPPRSSAALNLVPPADTTRLVMSHGAESLQFRQNISPSSTSDQSSVPNTADSQNNIVGSQVPFQSYDLSSQTRPDAGTATSAGQILLPQNQQSQVLENKGKSSPALGGDEWLTVLTKQMKQSHVEDLTLAQTPKGTGGGYGVGLDLDAILKEASVPGGPDKNTDKLMHDSAPLSATLLADWLEMTGNMDTKELEHALQEELDIGAPINLSDLSDVMNN